MSDEKFEYLDSYTVTTIDWHNLKLYSSLRIGIILASRWWLLQVFLTYLVMYGINGIADKYTF